MHNFCCWGALDQNNNKRQFDDVMKKHEIESWCLDHTIANDV